MADEELRRLEREARRAEDERAAQRLARARERAGLAGNALPLGWLVPLDGPLAGLPTPLHPGTLVLGHAQDAGLVLREPGVALRHCEVVCETGDASRIEVRPLNDASVELLGCDGLPALVDGDVLELAGLRLLFRTAASGVPGGRAPAGPAALPSPAAWIAAGLPFPVTFPFMGAGITIGGQRRPFGWLLQLSGAGRGTTLPLLGGPTDLGLDADGSLVLPSKAESTARVRIDCDLDLVWPPAFQVSELLDDGQGASRPLRDGDVVACGSGRLRLYTLYPQLPASARASLRLASISHGAVQGLVEGAHALDPWRSNRLGRDPENDLVFAEALNVGGARRTCDLVYAWDLEAWHVEHMGHGLSLFVGPERQELRRGRALLWDGEELRFHGPGDQELVFVLEHARG